MNIALVLTQKFDPNSGGVQRTTSKLADIYQSKQHNVIIISIGNHKTHVDYYNDIVVNYININEARYLKNIFQDEKIDCIINQMGYSVRLTKLLRSCKNANTKVINTLRINPLNFYDNHSLFINNFLERRKLGFLNTFLLRKAILTYHIIKQNIELNYVIKNTNAFVMLSEYFKHELFFLAPNVKKYEHKIFGIGNPFERPLIDISTLEKENIILFVGRLNKLQKRVDLLMEIWKKLHETLPDWRFWVVGEGEDQDYMKVFCNENKLDRVTFFGKDNPNDYYKKAKLFHMTSAFEGFGNVLIEAQSYGCVPMLFNSYAAASDIVLHEKNGVLVQPFDTNEYVKRTIELIHNPMKIAELSINSLENVERFSFEETYLKWDAIFNTLKKYDQKYN